MLLYAGQAPKTNMLMKQTLFFLSLILTIGLFSCRKSGLDLNVKQNDSVQIKNYISTHGLSAMQRDTTGGDTSGMYYQILKPGSGAPVNYFDKVYFVFTIRTFDGSYVSSDTIANHYYDFLGHVHGNNLPLGLQTALHNILKYRDASMRLLIPSHLAYGRNGNGSGSSQVANNRIGGNACLDYYVHVIGDIPAYDDQVIKSYMAVHNLTGYTKTATGLYYKVLTPATSNIDPITENSTATCTYTGQILNGSIFDGTHNGANSVGLDVGTLTPGPKEGLINYAQAGTKLSLLIPSALGYSDATTVGPVYSCLRFTFQVISVTP
jgi:FKBP-type peptidyl-prolyl cis-trans isomerase FkpA